MALEKFTWENGSQTEPAKVEVGGISYNVVDAQYEGSTPLSASNLNLMQDTLLGNVKDDLNDESKIASCKAVGNATGMILWTNSSPTSTFDTQTVTLSSGNYDFYEIYCAYNNGNANMYVTGYKTIKGKGMVMDNQGYGSGLSVRRKVDYTDATHLLFSTAYGGANIDNGYLIPIYIIGYKTGLFD